MNIGVVGFGNLGKALVKGLIFTNIVDKDKIFVCAKSDATLAIAVNDYCVNATSDINMILSKADIIFLVLKEKSFEQIGQNIDKNLLRDKLIVSCMAGVSIEKIKDVIGIDLHITRAMPSIAIAEGKGVIGYTKENSMIIKDIFQKLGYAILIEENDIEKITAFSACGLGFASYILASFVKAGVDLGFDKSVSEKIITNTFSNAIEMSNFEQTINAVATKGGATEQGLNFFKDNNVDVIINGAIQKAYEKVKG